MGSTDDANRISMRTEAPMVSVIIPAFNRNHTLPRALASVIDQTFQNLEIIIVDDASAQPVEQVVASFEDSRVRLLVHDTNRGANAARNTAIRVARGKYIAFLDSDDEWDKNKLQVQVEALEGAPLPVAAHYTGYDVYLGDGAKKRQTAPFLSGDLLPVLLRENVIGTLSSFVVRRSVLEEVDGFDEALPSVQDWDLYIRIAKKYEFLTSRVSLVRYNFGDDSITRNMQAKGVGLEMFLKKHGTAMAQTSSAFSRQMVKAGHYYCRSGSFYSGRRMFRRAIRIYPFAINAYLFLVISLFGGRFYERAVGFRKKALPFV